MWFKNLSLMRLPADLQLPADMEAVLAVHPLRSPGPLELETRGFVSPFSRSDACFSLSSSDAHLIAVGQESRLLPSSVLTNAVAERIADHELKTGRKPGKRLRNEFREAVLNELLPRAFIKHSRTCAYGTFIARANGKAASCTVGEKQAVEALAAKVVDGPSIATEDLDRRGIWHVRSAA